MTDMRAWYTSGDGCDVASGDEYHHGYTVHARASDPETAQLIADAVNLKRLIKGVGSNDLWRFTSALKWMHEGSKQVTLHPEGVSFEWNGGRAGWPGPWMKKAGADERCPGEGKCHGPVKWCERCGLVADVCDAPRCDTHAAYCEKCGAYIGPGSLVEAADGRADLCAECPP